MTLETNHSSQMLVSIIVPCRNERAYILAFCDAVAAQVLPQGLNIEVLIADGMSTDGTREVLAERAAQDARIRLVDNPVKIVSTGLNACLAHARGEIVVRMDVHTVYAPDYVAECVAALARTGADNVGGAWKAEGHIPMQKAVAAAFQSRLVSGGALSRQLDYEGEADTVYLGAWRRCVFERFGGFDESLVRNQDDEHNLRISKGGGRIWQSARIRSTYHPRATLKQVFRQYMQYGYWKPFVMRKHRQPAAIRHLVPGVFVATLIACAVLTLFGSKAGLALGLALLVVYGLFTAAAAWHSGVNLNLVWRVMAVIAAYHIGYGWGTLRGWADVMLRGSPSPSFGVLTR
ncbi:MAG: glycosyltransferase family 2 protein [Cellvibrionaceae bacterium]|nr:glycosyltransferase family 2 protein [Cellvibrionaceae bacterium]